MLLKKPGQFAVGSATQSGAGLLDLNFLNSDATLSNTITHSRAGNATMVASDGLIKWAPHNLLTYSEQFDNAAWNKFNTTITSNATTAPNGTITADLANYTNTSASLQVLSLSLTTDIEYTLGLFLKYYDTQWARIFNNASSVWVDLQNGILGTDDSNGATIIALEDGWYFVSVPEEHDGSVNINIVSSSADGSVTEAVGGIYLWGAHLYRSDLGGMAPVPAGERSFPSASTYVPTTSSARYLPRVGHHVYNGYAWVNEGVLAESEARTNLAEDSNKFDSANWTLTDAGDTLTASAAVSPDGETNAWLFAPDSTSGAHILRNPTTFSSGVTYTISAFLKAAGRRYCHLTFGGATFGLPSYDYRRGIFDLQDGAVYSAPTDGIANIQSFGSGWYRCSVTITPSIAASANLDIYHVDTTDPTVNTISDGNGSDGIYIYGAQIEAAHTPSSYIPTAGATVTRAAETFTIPAANLPYNSTALSMAIQGRVTYQDTNNNSEAVPTVWFKDSNNYFNIILSTDSTRTGDFRFGFRSNGGPFESHFSTSNYTPGVFVPFNVAVRASGLTNYINIAADGVAVTQEAYTGTGTPDLSATDLNLASTFMGTVERFRVWGLDLGDGGIEGASS